MKHRYQTKRLDLRWLRNTSMALTLLALVQGCASEQPKKVEMQPVVQGIVLPAEARADFEAAMALVHAGEHAKSIELFNKVITAVPNNAISSINLALVYKKLGKLKQAEESLTQALIAEPENPVAQNEYALIYRKTGRFAEARGLYEKILVKYPNFIMVHKNLGILCDMYMKDYECALKHYAFYSDVVQSDKTVKIWIADLQKRSGR